MKRPGQAPRPLLSVWKAPPARGCARSRPWCVSQCRPPATVLGKKPCAGNGCGARDSRNRLARRSLRSPPEIKGSFVSALFERPALLRPGGRRTRPPGSSQALTSARAPVARERLGPGGGRDHRPRRLYAGAALAGLPVRPRGRAELRADWTRYAISFRRGGGVGHRAIRP